MVARMSFTVRSASASPMAAFPQNDHTRSPRTTGMRAKRNATGLKNAGPRRPKLKTAMQRSSASRAISAPNEYRIVLRVLATTAVLGPKQSWQRIPEDGDPHEVQNGNVDFPTSDFSATFKRHPGRT